MAHIPFGVTQPIVLAALIVCVLGLLGPAVAGKAQEDDAIAPTIVAMERAALDRWGKGDPDGYLEIYSDGVSYFDPSTELRVDGIDALRARYAPVRGKIKIVRYEMLNPSVQVHGDCAVLTFNLVDHVLGPNGATTESRWNSTEVYARIDGAWRIVHSHWALTEHAGGGEEGGG